MVTVITHRGYDLDHKQAKKERKTQNEIEPELSGDY